MPYLKRRGRLGTIATGVNGSLVYGSNPVGTSRAMRPVANPIRHILPPTTSTNVPVTRPVWGSDPPRYNGPISNMSNGYGTQGALAAAQLLLQTNPGALTPLQWQMLQQAGLLAGTLPYSSAGAVTTSNGTTPASTAPAPSSSIDIGATLNADYAGMPLWAWIAASMGAYFLFFKQGGRR